jgi:GTPase SAR1 family protein
MMLISLTPCLFLVAYPVGTGNPLSLSSCNSIACSLDGQILASGFSDGTIYLLNSQTGQQIGTLEGHTDQVYSVSFSFDGHLLASQSFDNTIRCWRTDTWEIVAALSETKFSGKESLLHGKTNLAFHPTASILATVSGGSTAHIWDLNLVTLLGSHLNTSPVRYTNAKIVLVGDSGVGKSGLGLVLAKQHFVPTESTHGRHVWVFDKREVETHERRKETREILLWDLAGQPGYRLIHQLHLNEVAIAMIVFDAHSETNPFGGVEYWNRALRLAQRLQSNQGMLLQKFLVAARVDRGGIGVSHSRVDSLIKDLGFNGYFETSAKEDIGIEKLKIAIQETIDWNMLPWVSSTDLFQRIMNFLITEKATGRLLFTIDDLYRVFLQIEKISIEEENLYDQFRTCIGRFESRGLIRKLNFGNFVLLQLELLDSYASSLINAVKDEPDGLGSILEERVLMGDFPIPEDERLADRGQEKVLLIAMIDDLLRYEIILREPSDEGQYLIFPSQSTREHPDLPDPQGKTVVFSFEGPVLGIYTTLAVRLSHSGMFKKQELWKNAVIYTTKVGGTCGIFLQSSDEGQGILSLFFDKITSEETRIYFEEYVETHLRRRAIAESVKRNTIIACKECNTIVEDKVVQLRLVRGFNWLNCPVCDKRVEILPKERPATPLSLVIQLMDRTADTQRERETIQSIIQGKLEIKDFDVYLCHNDQDKSEVKGIGRQLKENGILPWLDEWELRPGLPWQRLLEEQIERIRSVAIFVGKDSTEPWRQMEVEAFLREFVERGCPVIPVILPGTYAKPEFPIFLKGMTWVDFRKQDPDPMEQLIWGISGKRGYNTV